MSNCTSARLVADITKDDVVLVHPQTGSRGRWTVLSFRYECERHVAIEYLDEYTDPGAWLLLVDSHLTVEITPREAQQIAACALAVLLPAAEHLPLVRWSADDVDGQLNAHIGGADADQIMQAWAEFFGSEVTRHGRTLTVEAVYEGAPVRMYATLPADAAAKVEEPAK